MDSNQLLSKPEFCLFMYLMHALRNFGVSFHLPNQITPHQAAKILGLEQQLRPNALGVSGAGQQSVVIWLPPLLLGCHCWVSTCDLPVVVMLV